MKLLRDVILFAAAAGPVWAGAAASTCQARSASPPPTVVELYTSEGCSSCPPADHWLSGLKGRSDVLALAFHVDYWDRLGWVDRFASASSTARQQELVRQQGGPYVYTPQVVVNGRDWRDWPRLPEAAPRAPAPALTMARDGDVVSADIAAAAGGPAFLDGYWAVLEDGYRSQVRAGENAGHTLDHDSVVRLYEPVPAWAAADGKHFQLTVSRGVAEHPRRVAFVVTDAATHRPLQALALGC